MPRNSLSGSYRKRLLPGRRGPRQNIFVSVWVSIVVIGTTFSALAGIKYFGGQVGTFIAEAPVRDRSPNRSSVTKPILDEAQRLDDKRRNILEAD